MTFSLSLPAFRIAIGSYSATFDHLGFIAGRRVGQRGAWECGWTRHVGWTASPVRRVLPHGYPHFPDDSGSGLFGLPDADPAAPTLH